MRPANPEGKEKANDPASCQAHTPVLVARIGRLQPAPLHPHTPVIDH